MAYSDPREALAGAKTRIERFADTGEITDADADRILEIVEA